MKTEQRIFSEGEGWVTKSDNSLGTLAQLVFLFGNREILKQKQPIDFIREAYPNAEIVGCSTSGEIYQEEVFNNNIICTAVWFEKTRIEIAKEVVHSMDDSFSVGEKLAAKLDKEHLAHLMVLSEGLNINGSELTKGINKQLEERISVTGGLAGDQDQFSETVIVHNQAGEKKQIFYTNWMASPRLNFTKSTWVNMQQICLLRHSCFHSAYV